MILRKSPNNLKNSQLGNVPYIQYLHTLFMLQQSVETVKSIKGMPNKMSQTKTS